MQKRPQTKILIVDDEKEILELLRQILYRNGFSVDIDLAESAEEGIKKIHNTPYDLIITDIKMPGMSGNEFFDYVKNNVEQSIPIIAMSGTPWLLENSIFDAVLAKPFSIRDMLGMVQQFIPRTRTTITKDSTNSDNPSPCYPFSTIVQVFRKSHCKYFHCQSQ